MDERACGNLSDEKIAELYVVWLNQGFEGLRGTGFSDSKITEIVHALHTRKINHDLLEKYEKKYPVKGGSLT